MTPQADKNDNNKRTCSLVVRFDENISEDIASGAFAFERVLIESPSIGKGIDIGFRNWTLYLVEIDTLAATGNRPGKGGAWRAKDGEVQWGDDAFAFTPEWSDIIEVLNAGDASICFVFRDDNKYNLLALHSSKLVLFDTDYTGHTVRFQNGNSIDYTYITIGDAHHTHTDHAPQQDKIEARYGADAPERMRLATATDDVPTLQHLVHDIDVNVRYSAVMNRDTPRRLLERLLDDEVNWISEVAQARLATRYVTLIDLSDSPHWATRDAVALNPNCPLEILIGLCRDEDYTVRSNAAQNKQIPATVLEQLSHDVNPFVRLVVAHHPNSPDTALARLSTDFGATDRSGDDVSMLIRYRVAQHPNTPQTILEKLRQDEDSGVSKAAQENWHNNP